MRIGIDIRALLEGRHTGVEEYTINLLRRLFMMGDSRNKYLLFISGQKSSKLKSSILRSSAIAEDGQISLRRQSYGASATKPYLKTQNYENILLEHLRVPNRLLNLSFKVFSRPHLDKLLSGVNVFWAPNINLVPTSKGCKKVVTFHDLSFVRYPEFFSLKRRLWHKFINPRKLAQEADRIIAVSESTKQDLVELYKIKPEKINIVYSGIGKKFKVKSSKLKVQKIKKKYRLPDKFILFLGTIEPRKNLIGLIRAYELLRGKTHKLTNSQIHKLIIAGTKGWLYEDIFKIARQSKYSKDIIFTGFIEDEDKPYLYNLASLFVYPSFYEGFGFPPLEAMACGLPTITSNVSSLPEIVGDAGIMVDPYKPGELALAMEMILSDGELRQRLSEKGIEQAKKFSWKESAKSTLNTLLK